MYYNLSSLFVGTSWYEALAAGREGRDQVAGENPEASTFDGTTVLQVKLYNR